MNVQPQFNRKSEDEKMRLSRLLGAIMRYLTDDQARLTSGIYLKTQKDYGNGGMNIGSYTAVFVNINLIQSDHFKSEPLHSDYVILK
ncbi:hypothetical protein M3226_10725 [Neobacillus cucumis]|uniref:hypothetical protein n=1 Tax=Neobacillus cucumis TaxID=1740721 RepID=UPI00203DDB6A|nr:hypothetical protein [Neobacillus cucumis]MCM3726157.1 hypothetical protein [Neobacillus cucumis]